MNRGGKNQELRNANDKALDDQKKQDDKIRIMNEKFQNIEHHILIISEKCKCSSTIYFSFCKVFL